MATTRSQAKIARAVGLAAQHDRPGGLAGVFDQFARGVDGAGDGALEVAVMAAVEVGLVAAGRCRCGGGDHGGLRSVGAACAPPCGRCRPAPGPRAHGNRWRAGSPDTWGSEQPRPRGLRLRPPARSARRSRPSRRSGRPRSAARCHRSSARTRGSRPARRLRPSRRCRGSTRRRRRARRRSRRRR